MYALLLLLGLNYAISNFGALVAGILFGFKTQGKLVFGNPDNRLIWRFVACWLLIYGMNVTFIHQMMSIGLNAYISGVLALPVMAVISYLVQRFVVFRVPDR